MEQNKKTAKEKLVSFVSEYSNKKFVSSIVTAAIGFIPEAIFVIAMPDLLDLIHNPVSAALFIPLILAFVLAFILDLIALIFTSISLSLSSFNFKAIKNKKSVTMFVISLTLFVVVFVLAAIFILLI